MRKRRTRHASSPLIFLGGLLALYLLGPIVWFLMESTTAGMNFSDADLRDAALTSVESATLSTGIIVLLGVPLARMLARSHGFLVRVVGVGIQLPLALPPVMSGIVLIYLVGPYTWAGEHLPLTESLYGVVIAQTFVAAPFLVIAARSAFAGINADVDDLAATLGLGAFARFWRVELPLALPGVIAGALLTWLRAFGEYGATSLIAYHPSTLPVYTSVQFAGSGLEGTSAPTVLALILAALVLVATAAPRTIRRPHSSLPTPERPENAPRTPVAFALNHRVDDFHLNARYAATSHRLAILGPSGSGKSLLLKSLAGLIDAERVVFAEDDVTALPTQQRQLGYVPQNRLLFTHRSVWQNVTFSPRARGGYAAWWLRAMGLEQVAHRSVEGLSGGEQQRASLVQALSCQARLLLLDEPFSALDTPTRDALVIRLRELQQQENLSSVLVTHNPAEALMLADEVVVLEAGRIVQAGGVREVFAQPCSLRAAQLLGVNNVLEVHASADDELALADGLRVKTPGVKAGVSYLIRLPENALSLTHDISAESMVVAVCDVIPAGAHHTVILALGGHHVWLQTDEEPQRGQDVHVNVDISHVTWWPKRENASHSLEA